MDIAMQSVSMAQAQLMQQVSTSVTKKVMDVQEVQLGGILQMMQGVPSFGHTLDIRA